jgi:hypothetical protein
MSAMSRYERMQDLARKYLANYRTSRSDCRRFAHSLAHAFAEFLGSPAGSLFYVDVDPDLSFGEDRGSIHQTMPELAFNGDGFWYYGLGLRFEQGNAGHTQIFLIGLKDEGGRFIIRGYKDEELGSSNGEDAQRFFAEFAGEIEAAMSGKDGGKRRRIGFVTDPG